MKDGLIARNEGSDSNGDPYVSYVLTDLGRERLLSRYAEIRRAEESSLAKTPSGRRSYGGGFADDLDDDVPF